MFCGRLPPAPPPPLHTHHPTPQGTRAATNFPPSACAADLAAVAGLESADVVAYVRRRSPAFARGRSPFRGVSGVEGRWEARIGTYLGRKNVRRIAILVSVWHRVTVPSRPMLHASATPPPPPSPPTARQVSLGVHCTEEGAARAYDRALIVDKGDLGVGCWVGGRGG